MISINIYEQIVELLVQKTGWKVELSSSHSDDLAILVAIRDKDILSYNYKKSTFTKKIEYSIKFISKSNLECVDVIVMEKFQNYCINLTRKCYIKQTLDINNLVEKIIKEIPFKSPEPFPKGAWIRKRY